MLLRRLLMNSLLVLVSMLAACRPAPDNEDSARLDKIVSYQAENGKFMGSVLVAKADSVVLGKGYGMANLEWDVPNTPSTKYRLGSVTKQFTAAAILLLEEQGKLKVEDLVRSHLPDAPKEWEKVSLFHLLTHTSGIPSVTDLPDYATWQMFDSPAEKTLSHIRNMPLQFAPGSQFRYSNSGYILLGYLVERISGQKYADFVQEKIFTPLGMKDSGYDSNTAIIPKRAAGYAPSSEGKVNAGYINMTFPQGAGALYSTTEDLLRWTQGLFGGKLLSAASLQKMTTPFKDGYAFGVGVADEHGHKVILHSGGIEGFNTVLKYYPDEKITIAVLANLNGDAAEQIGSRLGSAMHGEAVVLPSDRLEVEVSADALTKFVGAYELDPGANARISLSSGKLAIQIGPDEPEPLLAETATRFFSRTVDFQIDFEQDASGNVTTLVLHQDGEDHRALRIAERVVAKLPPEVLSRYAGTYELGPGFDIAMTVEDGRLMSQATGQSKVELYAEAEDRFFLKVANAQVNFVKRRDGRVTGLILRQGGKDRKAPRR